MDPAYVKQLEGRIVELTTLLSDLVTHVEQDLSREEGSNRLWSTVDRINDKFGANPSSVYVTQDPEFDKGVF
jgi:hypothetical protein